MTTMTERPPGVPGAGPPHLAPRIGRLLGTVPDDVDGVVGHLEQLQEMLVEDHGRRDGVAAFNRLHLRITEDIRAQLDDDHVPDKDFLARLDVELARRYLQALRASVAGGVPPRSWAVLVDRRSQRRISPVQLAVVGANALVNLDLPAAVVRTCTVLGRGAPGAAERADCRAVHDVVTQHLAALIRDGASCCIAIVLPREIAWRQALELWDRRSRPTAYEREIDALDLRTALLGRGLLTPGALT
ncbi:hypothetical protein Ae168Ps1_0029 [Pseudonocardia sp. Ae168_Ps1]|uniref:DUF5995 family protein n=1 Tax=unclassified Pseudonocardia TaxID=2619320 RepID=UPI00094AEC93|nr:MULTISPECIES: DUF5995 family protein [unclassified Pseudonocardia]OLL71651.1 hypothetical protein Ae150APs1_0029 [Pseudonocardia sp. Ae150A_Ps1]OLL77623.1 hypothetical protein Ae168Ps1_0029 [Pseudonocardia sp. Ae168_Ps1]OLL88259.1 hypothetical protein Ae263Ps1_5314c [Pseudonocardia sp. Ae263_Ps1]OLL91716.1 hypothetical protein Ae356Ps1_1613 [Pseudonocardia sp. Ae356_Ps1]